MKRFLAIIVGVITGTIMGFLTAYLFIFFWQPNLVVDFYLRMESFDHPYNGEVILILEPFELEIPLKMAKKQRLDLAWSPNKKLVGYMENIHKEDDESWEKEWALKIINPRTLQTRTIYEGDYHTVKWEWLQDDELIIYYDCGTECLVGWIIDVKTGKRKQEILAGTGYQWSADKNWFSAYRYSGKYGIVVSNKNQDKTYEYLKEREPDYQYNSEEKFTAFWAPTRNLLAMIKEKNGKEQLELVIVDFDRDGQVLTQKDFGEKGCESAFWYNNGEFACFREGLKEIIRLSN